MRDIYPIISDCFSRVTPPTPNYVNTHNMIRKVLSMKDRNKRNPGIIWIMSNRKGGKTYPMAQLLLQMHADYGVRCGLYRRWGGEVSGYFSVIFAKVFSEDPKWAGYWIREDVIKKDSCIAGYLCHKSDGEDVETLLGYCFSINSADNIKPLSPVFEIVEIILQDEFQASKYCPEETEKYVDLRFTLRRNGQQMPVIMLSNSLDVQNPYFSMWRISTDIKADTKYYHGNGIVGLRFYNSEVAAEEMEDPFNVACRNSRMIACNIDNTWLNDDSAGVAKPTKSWGRSRYVCTVHARDIDIGVRYYPQAGYYYMSPSVDATCEAEYTLYINDKLDSPLLQRSPILRILRTAYGQGKCRFSDIICKSALTDVMY